MTADRRDISAEVIRAVPVENQGHHLLPHLPHYLSRQSSNNGIRSNFEKKTLTWPMIRNDRTHKIYSQLSGSLLKMWQFQYKLKTSCELLGLTDQSLSTRLTRVGDKLFTDDEDERVYSTTRARGGMKLWVCLFRDLTRQSWSCSCLLEHGQLERGYWLREHSCRTCNWRWG